MKPETENLLRPSLLPVWLGVGLLWLLHWLPLPLLAALGNAIGWLLSMKPGKRRRVVATNLALCFPEASTAMRRRWLRQTFQASMRSVLEHGVLWWGSEARLRRLVRIDNPDAARGDGIHPVIWLAPHFVGFIAGGTRLSLDQTMANLYARARNPVSNKIMLKGRSRFSSPVLIEKNDGIKPVIKALKDGIPLHYSPDQDQGRQNSVFTPFFGVNTATVSALPRLARLTNAQVIPVVTRQLPWGRGYAVRFYPPWDDYPSDDQEADVARMNAFIEARIREMPEQYLWLHRRFKTRPVGEPGLYE